ncbi:MAG: hypothetical protein AAGA53_08015 [Pseudomonadota bacterium]
MELFLTGIFASCAVGALKMQLPERFKLLNVWRVVGGMILIYLSFWSLATSAVGYNDAGYCTHIRTFRGAEGAKCDLGWYFSGWGETTKYPHFITVTNTIDRATAGASVETPYTVRLADNWSGKISQTTRFELPHDRQQFVELARNFGSPEKLVTAALRPAVNASMDSVASIFTMEEYYEGGMRDKFKTEFHNSISKGMLNKPIGQNLPINAETKSTAENQPLAAIRRTPHSFLKYGIGVDLAIMHTLQPNEGFVELIKDRKHAANKRILAREKRLAEEEQHLLAVARQEIEIAKQKTEALIDQAKRTVNAETEKIMGIIAAQGALEEAQISVKTVEHTLKRTEVEAEIKKIMAQVNAFERKAMLTAEGTLDKRLKAYVDTNKAWANAYAKRSTPTTAVFTEENAQTVRTLPNEPSSLIQSLKIGEIEGLKVDEAIETHSTER